MLTQTEGHAVSLQFLACALACFLLQLPPSPFRLIQAWPEFCGVSQSDLLKCLCLFCFYFEHKYSSVVSWLWWNCFNAFHFGFSYPTQCSQVTQSTCYNTWKFPALLPEDIPWCRTVFLWLYSRSETARCVSQWFVTVSVYPKPVMHLLRKSRGSVCAGTGSDVIPPVRLWNGRLRLPDKLPND